MNRRQFLKALGGGSTQLALSALALGSWIQRAHGSSHCDLGSWGAIPGSVGGWTCASHSGYKILEIYLHAGASQWETFWLPGNGSAPNFSDFDMGPPNTPPEPGAGSPNTLDLSQLNWGNNTANFPCEPPDIPASSSDAALFAAQSGGGNIYWGAPAKPLYRRADILSRCRMVTQYHGLFPHEAAIPFAHAGLTLGNVRRAGSGAAIQRRAHAVDPMQVLPVSYVLHAGVTLSANAAAVTGTHPGSSRPLVIRVQNNNAFFDSLARTGITPESDELFLALRHEYRDRLRFRGGGNPIRSVGFDGYWVAAELLKDAPSMQSLFAGNLLVIDGNVDTCPEIPGSSTSTVPAAKTMLQAAASLLSSGPARYVCVIDKGIANTYDTHGGATLNHLLHTTTNLYNILHHLAEVIHHPTNNPSGTLDLNDTLVVINSEFGRTPWINANNGRDHWPGGYAAMLIGGPISGGASIRGAIDSADGFTLANHRYKPTDIRGAMLLAAGIDPFAVGNFRFSDFSDAIKDGIGMEQQIRERLKGWILGV